MTKDMTLQELAARIKTMAYTGESDEQVLRIAAEQLLALARIKSYWIEMHKLTGEHPEGPVAALQETLKQAKAKLEKQQQEIRWLRRTLKPFAEAGRIIEEDAFPVYHIVHSCKDAEGEHKYTLTAGDFYKAMDFYYEANEGSSDG